MKRIYEKILLEHFDNHEECIFLSGARQVGKTTIAESIRAHFEISDYFNWDFIKHRQSILTNNLPILEQTYLKKPLIIFDEIHKYKEWKNYIKGLYDIYHHVSFLITGSARLDIYRQGGDSMMGRFFLYHVHPFSVAEILSPSINTTPFRSPKKIDDAQWESLLKFGGFPKPLLTAEERFYQRWISQRNERLFEEDIRDVFKVHELKKMQVLAKIIQEISGGQVNYSSISRLVQISDQTIRSWITLLQNFYYCFTISPWSTNVIRSLIKEPKIYLYDWSMVQDNGKKYENFIASQLLKAVHFWTEYGLGEYELFYLRDKNQHEVDFLITQNGQPWLMVEVKSSMKEALSKHLFYFQKQLNVPHIMQVVIEADYIDEDCFSHRYNPIIVPAKTFLSQLI